MALLRIGGTSGYQIANKPLFRPWSEEPILLLLVGESWHQQRTEQIEAKQMNKKQVGRPRSYTREQVRCAIDTVLKARGIHLRIADGIDAGSIKSILQAEFGIAGQMREDTLQIEIDETLRELQSEQLERDREQLTEAQASMIRCALTEFEDIFLTCIAFEREGFSARSADLKSRLEQGAELHRHKLRETQDQLAEARDALSDTRARLADTEVKLSDEQCRNADLRLELARVSGQLEGMRAAVAANGLAADPARSVPELHVAR